MDDINNAVSPLQRQATQIQRIVGGQAEMIEKAEQTLKDHEGEIIKLGNKAETSDDLHRKGTYSQPHLPLAYSLFALV